MTPAVTVCSDFGSSDYFPAVMKGVILSINPSARIVDLTNEIPHFDTARAAFVINSSYKFFPTGSVHLAVVDPGVGSARKPLALSAGGNFFVGPDSGIFTYIFREFPSFSARVIENPAYLRQPVGSTFHGRDIFAPVAAHLSLGADISLLGAPLERPAVIDDLPHPVSLEGERAEGVVAYADSFGNLISNIISQSVPPAADFEISGFTIKGISPSYSARRPGDAVAVRGSSGFVEVALNRASALERFGGEGTKIIVRKK